jgi:hypothetical protein
MADVIDYNALAQAFDTTFGRSSTPQTASYSVKFSLVGTDGVLVSFAAIVNFATERQMIEMKRAYAQEAQSVIGANVKIVKNTYKELTGETITFKHMSDSDSVEIINFNSHTAHRTAYYRCKTMFNIA